MLSLSQIQLFSIVDLIKAGSYSSVYKAEDDKGQLYAIKLMPIESKKPKPKTFFSIFKKNHASIKEGKILSHLQGISGVPRLFFSGENPDINANMIVTELLGKDLGVLFTQKQMFSLEFISRIGCRLISILEEIHKRGVVHRDIKPDNILMGLGKNEEVFLADFGLSKLEKKKNVKKVSKPQFVGNLKYASVSTHFGEKITKKDDLESLGYVLMNFVRSNLPWDRFKDSDLNEKIERIGMRKQEFLRNELGTLPTALEEYFKYLMELKKDDKINYQRLKEYVLRLTLLKNDEIKNEINFMESKTQSETPEKDHLKEETVLEMQSMEEEFTIVNLSDKIRGLENFEK